MVDRHEMSDVNYNTVNTFVTSIQKLDFITFSDLISPECKISYTFNGVECECTEEEYIQRLFTGHFQNTTKVRVINTTISADVDNTYNTYELCHFTRDGRLTVVKS